MFNIPRRLLIIAILADLAAISVCLVQHWWSFLIPKIFPGAVSSLTWFQALILMIPIFILVLLFFIPRKNITHQHNYFQTNTRIFLR